MAVSNTWNLTAVYNTYDYIDFQVFNNDYDRGGPTFSDGSPFHFVSATNGNYGTLSSASVKCTGATNLWCVRYTATHYGPFTDTFTYTIIDAGGSKSTATVTINMPAP